MSKRQRRRMTELSQCSHAALAGEERAALPSRWRPSPAPAVAAPAAQAAPHVAPPQRVGDLMASPLPPHRCDGPEPSAGSAATTRPRPRRSRTPPRPACSAPGRARRRGGGRRRRQSRSPLSPTVMALAPTPVEIQVAPAPRRRPSRLQATTAATASGTTATPATAATPAPAATWLRLLTGALRPGLHGRARARGTDDPAHPPTRLPAALAPAPGPAPPATAAPGTDATPRRAR